MYKHVTWTFDKYSLILFFEHILTKIHVNENMYGYAYNHNIYHSLYLTESINTEFHIIMQICMKIRLLASVSFITKCFLTT